VGSNDRDEPFMFLNAALAKRASKFYITRSTIGRDATAGPKSKGVMAAIGDPHDRVTRIQRRSLLADGIVALLTAVLLMLTVTAVRALAPVAWHGLSWALVANEVTDPRQCASINRNRERLACFDHHAKELMRPPAKGAFAPPEAFGERKQGFDAR
jgi:hypothetical protein